MFVIAVDPENSLDTTAAGAVVNTTMNRIAIPGSTPKRNLRLPRNDAAGNNTETDALHSRIYPQFVYMLSSYAIY
jgi:hypothetical protein